MLTYDNVIAAARIGCGFDKLTEDDEIIAYLPIAWVGDHIFSYAQAIIAGLCVNCPESPDTVTRTGARSAPTYAFAPPRVFENHADPDDGPDGGCGALKRRMFKFFIDHGQPLGREDPERRARSPLGARLLYRLGDVLVYGPLRTASASPASRSATRRARRSGRRSSASTARSAST